MTDNTCSSMTLTRCEPADKGKGWNNYPEVLPKVPAGQTAVDVIVMTQDRRPYPMHWRKKDQKFIAGDAVIIAWKYKTA